MLVALWFAAGAQTVVQLITDYNGYWKSTHGAINPVKPDNSHNLLAFSYNNQRYSTGVNDALLTARGDLFNPGLYKALPVYQISGASTADTKIGLGAMYDGVYNGPSNPRPVNNISRYLTDGVNGLDLGTCVANLPAGTISFAVTNIQAQLIGDNIPDLLITQTADPSGSNDVYEFADVHGNRVGNQVSINLSTLPVLGNWTADFYDVNTNPMSLASGFTQTDRPLRIWASDFSAFGINASNISQISYFRIRLSGSSDIAFVAYNSKTVDLATVLPVTLNWFKGQAIDQTVDLNWQTATESDLSHFEIEYSRNGSEFLPLANVTANGNSTTAKNYSYTQRQAATGATWYRLKQVDKNGRFEYSSVIKVVVETTSKATLKSYPNPATDRVVVQHARATGREQYALRSMHGTVMVQGKPAAGSTQSAIDVRSLAPGAYLLVMTNGNEQQTSMIVKK